MHIDVRVCAIQHPKQTCDRQPQFGVQSLVYRTRRYYRCYKYMYRYKYTFQINAPPVGIHLLYSTYDVDFQWVYICCILPMMQIKALPVRIHLLYPTYDVDRICLLYPTYDIDQSTASAYISDIALCMVHQKLVGYKLVTCVGQISCHKVQTLS